MGLEHERAIRPRTVLRRSCVAGISASGQTTIRLTAAQTALYKLSQAAAQAPARPGGRYVIMTEKQDTYARTSVLDSLTGGK